MSALLVPVLLSCLSAVVYAGAAVLQERVAAESVPGAGAGAAWRSGRWWISVLLNGAGALLHVAALSTGPLSLVQPLGVLTLVFVLPLAALCGGRRAGRPGWSGALLVSAGLAGLLSLTAARPARLPDGAEQLTLAVVTVGAVAALTGLAVSRAAARPAVRSALLASAAGAAFGVASVFTKVVTANWGTGLPVAAQVPAAAVTAGLAIAGLFAAQAAYQGGGLAAPLATVTVVNPVVAAATGVTLLGEGFRYGATGVALALAAAGVTARGLAVLTARRADGPLDTVPAGERRETSGPGPAAGRAERPPPAGTPGAAGARRPADALRAVPGGRPPGPVPVPGAARALAGDAAGRDGSAGAAPRPGALV
ncbi:DMT family transporter [Streptomyces zingiberis]|uniref:DMT family transporter n=1 Tax=Streptomyces zingiberis TaxID=2053010 RepID=A0ABX1C1T7_9ACTN|nr:DMT family transporter [Streptomyces zingiberis]NJQ01569.1 DMT family transporter [Streptomyces zingiberis]